jgi:hypothetical protein
LTLQRGVHDCRPHCRRLWDPCGHESSCPSRAAAAVAVFRFRIHEAPGQAADLSLPRSETPRLSESTPRPGRGARALRNRHTAAVLRQLEAGSGCVSGPVRTREHDSAPSPGLSECLQLASERGGGSTASDTSNCGPGPPGWRGPRLPVPRKPGTRHTRACRPRPARRAQRAPVTGCTTPA